MRGIHGRSLAVGWFAVVIAIGRHGAAQTVSDQYQEAIATQRAMKSAEATDPPSESAGDKHSTWRQGDERLPPNLFLPTELRELARDMWRRTTSFKRQCARIEAASTLAVTVRMGVRPLGSPYRASTVLTRKRGYPLTADVWIALQDDPVELLAHELEHIVEQLDRPNVSGLADSRQDGVTVDRGEHIETRRAVAAGRLAAQEFRASSSAQFDRPPGDTATEVRLRQTVTAPGRKVCATTVSTAASAPSQPGSARVDVVALRQGISAQVGRGGTSVSVSANGRVVAFESHTSLLPADTNGVSDIYALDLHTRHLTLASQSLDASAANGGSTHPSVSGDGRYVVFESLATNLVAMLDLNDENDVFVRDMRNASTRRVSVAVGGGSTDGWSGSPVLAVDGDSVAFDSVATNLVPGWDANGKGSDVYVFRPRTGDLRRVSVATNGTQASSGVSYGPTISADGRFVAFTSRAQLGCGIPHGNERRRRVTTPPSDVYVRDLEGLTTQCVSRGATSSYHASIDRAGRTVAFVSEATNMTRDPRNHEPNVYLRDLTRDGIRLVSRNARGRPGNAASLHPAISGDGRFIAFESLASDLLCARRCREDTLDHNLVPDVYMFDVAANATTRLSTGCHSEVWWEASRGPALSADGATIAISSRHPISRDDLSDDDDLYVFRSHLLAQPTDTGHLAVHRK